MTKDKVTNEYGKIIGTIQTLDNGDKIVFDFYGKKLGTYKKSINKTLNFYGKIIGRGDLTGLLFAQKVK